LGRHYAAVALEGIYCSDLQRAVDTARLAFAARGLPILPDARLRECDYGACTRQPVRTVEAALLRHIVVPFPRGESLLMVAARVRAFLHEVAQQHEAHTIVVIGHRATKLALDYVSGTAALEEIVRAPWEWRQVPIWRYVFDGRVHAGSTGRRPGRPPCYSWIKRSVTE
jgi:broad specificity phosphatase PhoE